MGKFCRFCGTPIEEGCECMCQEAVADRLNNQQQASMTEQVVNQPVVNNVTPSTTKNINFGEILTNVKNAAFRNASEKSYLSVLITGFVLLWIGIMLFGEAICQAVFFAKWPFGMLLGTAIVLFITFFAVGFAAESIPQLISKKKINAMDIVEKQSCKMMLPMIILLMAGLFSMFLIKLSMFLIVMAICIGIHDLFESVKSNIVMKSNQWKFIIVSLICTVLTIIVVYVFGKMTGALIGKMFSVSGKNIFDFFSNFSG